MNKNMRWFFVQNLPYTQIREQSAALKAATWILLGFQLKVYLNIFIFVFFFCTDSWKSLNLKWFGSRSHNYTISMEPVQQNSNISERRQFSLLAEVINAKLHLPYTALFRNILVQWNIFFNHLVWRNYIFINCHNNIT